MLLLGCVSRVDAASEAPVERAHEHGAAGLPVANGELVVRRRLYDAPTMVAGFVQQVGISAGYDHSCGVTSTGEGHCWGNNANGKTNVPPGFLCRWLLGEGQGNLQRRSLRCVIRPRGCDFKRRVVAKEESSVLLFPY